MQTDFSDNQAEVLGENARGPKHEERSEECQDNWASATKGEALAIAVGDGLGSADRSATGSEVATETAIDELVDWLNGLEEPVTGLEETTVTERLTDAIETARQEVQGVARKNGNPIEQYHTTLSVVVATPEWYGAIAIGDSGLVGIRDNQEYLKLVAREESESATATTPLTGDPEMVKNRNRVTFDEVSLLGLAAFTDGLDRFVWDRDDNTVPREEFFDRIYQFITELESLKSPEAETQLTQFVDSKHFHQYSEDDKTLVIGRLPQHSGSRSSTETQTSEYENGEFIRAVEHASSPSISHVQQSVGCAYSTARRRLEALEEEGILTSKDAGRKRIWTVTGGD